MTESEKFQAEVNQNIRSLAASAEMRSLTNQWLLASLPHRYSYNFSALGRPIIQYPQDMVAMQELIWKIRPDLIIETGIAHGGSLILSASMLALLDYCDAISDNSSLDPKQSKRKVLGIDIDIRSHNRTAIENHPMAHLIDMIEGSSISEKTISQVKGIASQYNRVLVSLDSNHTHQHVLEELHAYAPLTSVDSYCVVFDTVIEDVPKEMYPDRPWGPGDSPKSAVHEFIKTNGKFEIDLDIDAKLQISVAPSGFLRRVR